MIIISDHLTHNAEAVYTFTKCLLTHIQNNPGPEPIAVLHRFTDNCAAQYKCKTSFAHLLLLENKHDIEIIYHYTESGHGKGPSDGLGAGIKKKLERLILGGKVVNNAYQTYLALRQNPSENIKQHIIYVPTKKIISGAPQKTSAKPIRGTHTCHMIKQWRPGTGILVCSDLSCSCEVCVTKAEGPCFYVKYRHPEKFFSLKDGKEILQKSLSDRTSVTKSCSSANPPACVDRARNLGGGKNTGNDVLSDSIASHKEDILRHNEIMADFEAKIAVKGWKIRGQTPEDGNCFFWSISDQLDRVQAASKTHSQLRHCVVEHISNLSEDDKAEMNQFITTDLEPYLLNIGTNGAYADHLCISVTSKMLPCTIQIVQANNPEVREDSDPTSVLVIGYLPEVQHYVSLEPLERYVQDDFVAVGLTSSRQKKFLYVAKVLKVDGDVQLRFLQGTSTRGMYIWPKADDVSWQSPDDILMKLSMPTLMPGRGLKLMISQKELELSQKQLKA